MTKLEFMKELESLLLDIPLEEREEALQYYNGYIEDAGEDHEDEIMKELGSPSKVASLIKADLNSNATDRESRGYFTERGYEDTIIKEEKYEIVGASAKENESSDHSNNKSNINYSNQTSNNNQANNANQAYNGNQAFNTNQTNNTNNTNQAKGPYYNNGTYQSTGSGYSGSTAGQSTYKNTTQKKNNSNTALILLIGIFTFPIWFPLLMTAFGIAIGIIAAILGIIFGFGIAGFVMMGVGIALFVSGLVSLSAPLVGLLLIGSGLLVLGLGMLFGLASVLLCKNVLPAIFKGIVELCRLPFKNRSVIA